MPHALLLSPSGFNGQRRAWQKPGGLTSIQGAQEAGRRGPWVPAWRRRLASGPGASDAGRTRQAARRCVPRGVRLRPALCPEVAPRAPEVAPCAPRCSGRSSRWVPSVRSCRRARASRREPSSRLPAEPARDPAASPGSGRAQRGCGSEASTPSPRRSSPLRPVVDAAAFAGLCAASRPGPLGGE